MKKKVKKTRDGKKNSYATTLLCHGNKIVLLSITPPSSMSHLVDKMIKKSDQLEVSLTLRDGMEGKEGSVEGEREAEKWTGQKSCGWLKFILSSKSDDLCCSPEVSYRYGRCTSTKTRLCFTFIHPHISHPFIHLPSRRKEGSKDRSKEKTPKNSETGFVGQTDRQAARD